MKSEFHSVHSAKEALELYKKTNDLKIIESIPVNSIDRYDVWQCVFEKEEPAYRLLQIKEFTRLFAEQPWNKLQAILMISILQRIQEREQPFGLSLKETLELFLSFFSSDILKDLSVRAEWFIKTRKNIVKPYLDKVASDKWVETARDLKKFIDSYSLQTNYV